MSFKRIICVLVGTFFLVSMIFVGCAPAKKPAPTPTKYTAPAPAKKIIPTPTVPAPARKMTTPGKSVDISRAKTIIKKAEAVTGVKRCTAVVTADTAYIGLNLKPGAKKERTESMVATKVKSAEPSISTIYISTDSRIFDRLKRIHDGITSGKPISNYTRELSTIAKSPKLRKVTP